MKKTPPDPCPRCVKLAWQELIRVETVMPIPAKNPPLSREKPEPCCIDCAAADALMAWMFRDPKNARPVWEQLQWKRLKRAPSQRETEWPSDLKQQFLMARICIGNDRQEQLRMPGAKIGLVYFGITKPSAPGDLDRHYDWLRAAKLINEENELLIDEERDDE